MSRAPRNSLSGRDWRPSATHAALRRRAELLADLRCFFAARGVMEVETPVLAASTVTDLHLESLSCRITASGEERGVFLQTSPEFAMKRLLAAGSGPIYQICKAFRDGEAGRMHNPEFTMLEWYRPGFDHHQLMDEMDQLLALVLGEEPAERVTYGEAFESAVAIDPHGASLRELQSAVSEAGLAVAGMNTEDRDSWLHLLMSHCVEPRLGRGRPTFLFDFPASQAALARIRPGAPPLAERFEVYTEGVELANGFHELTDATEQRRRFETDLEHRRSADLGVPSLDERFLAALDAGLPPCAGVALGVDRLLMRCLGTDDLRDVVSFAIDRA